MDLERLLVIAPHPDDEAIGAAGLIQRALAGGGAVHVAFITDGENNPWPQRVMLRKLFLGRGDRAAWGVLRRQEGLASLAKLGVTRDDVTFLGFPDHRIAALARAGVAHLRDAIAAIVQRLQPTLIVAPSALDLHADHRAIGWYVHSAANDTPIVTYIVHGQTPEERLAFALDLTPIERRRKREAIECHRTQLILSRERFLAYARPREAFLTAEQDLVSVDSRVAELRAKLRHALLVVLHRPEGGRSGVEAAADVDDRAGDVARLL